jgi:menaquinone-dependent protoporphyrinogen IX oxidase
MNRIIFFSLLNIIIVGKFSYGRLIYTARVERKSFEEIVTQFLEKALVKIEQEKFSDQDFYALMFFTNKMDEIKKQQNISPVYWYSRQG